MSRRLSVVSGVVGLVLAGAAGAGDLVSGIALGSSISEVEPIARRQCASYRIVDVSPPVFPLARDREAHLVCLGLETPQGTVERTVLVFGDGELVAMEARGGAALALIPADADADDYLHFQIFDHGERWLDQAADAVWLLSPGATHLNLFTWSNPLLAEAAGALPNYGRSAEIPPILDFEQPLEAALSRFKTSCPLLEVSRSERIWLTTQPENQTQVNCFGYDYAGFPRKFEAVYGDGKLHVVWILTGKGEEGRLRQALIEAFDAPISVNENWEVFADGRVALRKDKPEVLMLSETAAPHYREEIGLE